MRYTNLQAARFAGAAAVVVFHAACHGRDYLAYPSALTEPVPAYYFRTTIVFFFAVSGFVLALVLQTAPLGAFLRGRLLRLYPAYWALVAIVFAVRELAGRPVPCDTRGVLRAVFLWPAGPNKSAFVLGVEWTLVYEMLLSVAVVPLAALGRTRGLAVGAAAWLLAIVGRVVLVNGAELKPFPTAAEWPLSVMNAPFLLGVLAYFARDRVKGLQAPLAFAAAVGLAAGAIPVATHPGWSLLLQAVGTAAGVLVLANGAQLPAGHAAVRGGDVSYGVYLAHVPVMTAVYAVAAAWGTATGAVVVFGGVLALALGAAYGSLEWGLYSRLRAKPKLLAFPTEPLRKAA